MYCEKFATMIALAVLFLVAVGAVYAVSGDRFGRFMALAVVMALSSLVGFVVANVVKRCRGKA